MKKYNYLPYNKDLTKRAQELRNNMASAEKKLWYEYLRNHKYKFTRQKPIGNYVVDFYCSQLKLVIELDGETHISDQEILYDRRRTEVLENFGLSVLRFWNNDILRGGFGTVEEIIEKEIRKRGEEV